MRAAACDDSLEISLWPMMTGGGQKVEMCGF